MDFNKIVMSEKDYMEHKERMREVDREKAREFTEVVIKLTGQDLMILKNERNGEIKNNKGGLK